MSEATRATFQVPNVPAWAAGHFPGDPLMPGAKLLDAVILTLQQAGILGHHGCSIAQAKFTAPVRPGDQVIVGWVVAGERIRFDCEVAGKPVASGQLLTPA